MVNEARLFIVGLMLHQVLASVVVCSCLMKQTALSKVMRSPRQIPAIKEILWSGEEIDTSASKCLHHCTGADAANTTRDAVVQKCPEFSHSVFALQPWS